MLEYIGQDTVFVIEMSWVRVPASFNLLFRPGFNWLALTLLAPCNGLKIDVHFISKKICEKFELELGKKGENFC